MVDGRVIGSGALNKLFAKCISFALLTAMQNVIHLPCLPPLNKRFYKKAGSSLFFDTHTAIKILINPEEDSDEGGYQAELALFIISVAYFRHKNGYSCFYG